MLGDHFLFRVDSARMGCVKGNHWSDWKLACVVGVVLLGLAAFVVFVIHPGGFEGQIGWFFGWLPGATLGA